MSSSTVLVFGATSEGGLELCRRLSGDGVRVLAGVRGGSDHMKLTALGVECREADAMESDQVLNAMQDLGEELTIVSFLGGLPSGNRQWSIHRGISI